MGVQRTMMIACDGPCGKAQQVSSIPVGWFHFAITEWEKLGPGEKPKPKLAVGYFCPTCCEKALEAMKRAGFNVIPKRLEIANAK